MAQRKTKNERKSKTPKKKKVTSVHSQTRWPQHLDRCRQAVGPLCCDRNQLKAFKFAKRLTTSLVKAKEMLPGSVDHHRHSNSRQSTSHLFRTLRLRLWFFSFVHLVSLNAIPIQQWNETDDEIFSIDRVTGKWHRKIREREKKRRLSYDISLKNWDIHKMFLDHVSHSNNLLTTADTTRSRARCRLIALHTHAAQPQQPSHGFDGEFIEKKLFHVNGPPPRDAYLSLFFAVPCLADIDS